MTTIKINEFQFHVNITEEQPFQQLIDHFLSMSKLLGYSMRIKHYRQYLSEYIIIILSKQHHYFKIKFEILQYNNNLITMTVSHKKNNKTLFHELYFKQFYDAINQIIEYL